MENALGLEDPVAPERKLRRHYTFQLSLALSWYDNNRGTASIILGLCGCCLLLI